MKLVRAGGTGAGASIPAARPAAMDLMSHAMFRPRVDLIGGIAVDHGPVAGGDHRHLVDGEVLVQLVQGGGGASPAGADHGGGGLEAQRGAGGVKQPVQGAGDLAGGGGVVDRRAHHQAVTGPGLLRSHVDHVVVDAFAQLAASPAAGTAGGGVPAQPEDLRLQALLRQGPGHLVQGGIGAAILVGAAVEQQYLHSRVLLLRII